VTSQLAKAQPPLSMASPHPFYSIPLDSAMASVPGIPEGGKRLAGIYAEQKFGLKELSLLALDVYCPFSHSAVHVRINTYGSPGFRQTGLQIGFARVMREVRAVAGFHLEEIRIRNNPETQILSGKISLLWRKNAMWWIALDLDHFISFSSSDQHPGIKWLLVLGYQLSAQLNATVNLRQNAQTLFSLQYAPAGRIVLKAGFSNKPFLVSGMAGFRFGERWLHLINNYHPVLGMSTAMALTSTW